MAKIVIFELVAHKKCVFLQKKDSCKNCAKKKGDSLRKESQLFIYICSLHRYLLYLYRLK